MHKNIFKKAKFTIDKHKSFCYNSMAIKKNCYRDVAQLVARMVWDHDAAGSNPVISTIKSTVPFGTVLFICLRCRGFEHVCEADAGAQNCPKA